jgi:phosphatidylglycerol:prolipoprotein diacylglycerol transferase
MYPILFTIAGFEVRAWGVMVAVGIFAGLLVAIRVARKTEFTEEILTDYLLYGVLAGILGARAWEAIFSWENFAANPLRAFMFWDGGLSIQGAVVANLLVAWWYFRKKKLAFARFADIGAPGLIIGQAIGRIGCLLNGDAYGKPTDAWFGVIYQPGTPAYNVWGAIPLIPAELFEAVLDFGILAGLLYLYPRKQFDGQVALTYFIAYSLARFGLEFFRSDSLAIDGLKIAQVTALITAAIAFGMFIWLKSRQIQVRTASAR